MTHSQLFLRRFKAGLAFAFAICWISAFAQYPNAPNKIGLGRQTTGDGLVFRTSGKPVYTPTTAFNAWMALDTTTGNLWTYRGGEWFLEVAGDLRLVYPVVINKSGVDIKQGQVVMVDTVQLVQGDQVRVRPAIATVSNSQLIMGVASTDINNDSTGYISWFGYVREVDHADIAQTGVTLDVGDILYISATEAGRYTDTAPAAPNVNSTMALVVRKPNANNMTLLVRPWLNEKLGDLSDVDLAGLQTGDGIKWDGTKWVAGTFAEADSTVVSAGYGIDVSEVSNDFTVSADTNELATPYDVSLKQDKLVGTGLVKSTSGTISYITDNSTNWDDAYNDRITSAAFSGSGTKTLTLTQQDAGTITASFTDLQGVTSVTAGTALSGGTITTTGTISADTSVLSTKWFAADTASGVRDWVTAQGYTSNTGTVTSIATNNGITGGTITTTGTIGLTGQALSLHNLSTNGLIARTGAGTVAGRTITAGTGITVNNGDGVSGNPTITNSAPDQTVVLTAGTGINTSGTYPNFTITNSAPDQTVSIAAGTGISTSGSYPNFTITNSAPDQTVSITGAGINAVTGTYPNFTITGTEIDGSTTNELQNLSLSGQSLGITSGTGVTLPIIDVSAGSGISVTKASGNATVSATDASVSNEGTLGVGAGGANTAVITSNTSGATGVTINGGVGALITETTSTNGGTINVLVDTANIVSKTFLTNQGYTSNTGTVTSIATGYGLDGGTITTTGTLSVDTLEIATPYDVSLKQDKLTGTGLVKSTSGTISYITDNSTNWDDAYNDRITSAAFSGSGTKTLTLTQQDAGTVTANFTDLQGVTSVATGVGLSGGTITTTGTISADTTVLVSKTFLTNQGYTSNVGTVTSVATGVGLSGGTITSSGTISADTTVLASKTWTQTRGYLTSEVDGSVTNEGSLTVGAGSGTTSVINSNTSGSTGVTISASTGLSISEAGNTITLTNSAPDQTVSLTGAGITSISGTYPSFTITSTEVDGSTSNELQNLTLSGQSLGITSGSGVTLPVVGISAGTGIGVTSSSGTFTITNNSPDQTVSISSGTGITVSGSYPNFTVTNASPDQTVSISGAGINAVSGTYPNFTITGTEVDGSTTNELQNLSLTGQTLGISSGSGVTLPVVGITAGTGISTTSASGDFTITNSAPEATTARNVNATGEGVFRDEVGNELQFKKLVAGSNITLTGADSTVTIAASGGGSGTVTSITAGTGLTGGTITTSGTIGLTGQALALHNLSTNGIISRTGAGAVAARTLTAGTGISISNGDGVSGNPTITNSAPDQTVVLTAGTGINTSGTYPNFTITNSAPDQTVSIAAGTGISTSGSYPNFTITNSAPDQTVTIAGAGINSVSGSYPNFTITGTEVDGSTTNELQNLSLSGQSLGITSGTGVTLPIIDVSAGSGISVTKASGNATISATDASVSNEGTLGVGAGGANTAVITSNTSGATGVSIAGGSNIAITESTSSNGGTVTIAATGLPSSFIVQTRGETPSISAGTPVQNSIVNFTDTLNFAFYGNQAADVYTEVSANKISIVGEFSNLYNNSGSLTSPRTVSTAGHKLTISGSNTAQVLEINNTNTGTTTNALTLQSFGPPLQATRLTSVSGSIVPVSDYYVNTSSTAAAGLGGFHRFYIEDAGGLNKEAGRIGFRTSDATGNSYDSEAFISVRKDSSELKEGLTLLSTGQLQLKEYGDTLFTGTAVKYLAVDDDGKVIEVDGAAGTVKGTGAANKVAIWASADSLYQNTNLHWDEANGRLGINNTSPSERLHVGGNVRAERLIVNTFGAQTLNINNYAPTGSNGGNVFIGNGGASLTGTGSQASLNVGIGTGALQRITTGDRNLAIGGDALTYLTTGSVNVGIGGQSGAFITTGLANTYIAARAGLFNTTGSYNTGIGGDALQNIAEGGFNIAIGNSAAANLTGGSFSNTIIGNVAGAQTVGLANLTTLNNSVYVGNEIKASANSITNEIAIGYQAQGQGSNTAIIGNSSITNTYLRGKVSINTTASANTLDIEGGAAIGATYSGTNTAPTNGLLVEGKTLIGTTTGDRPIPLQVINNALIGGHLIGTSSTNAGNFSNLIIGAKAYGDSIQTSLGNSNTVIGYEAWGNADDDPGSENVVIGTGAALLTSANSTLTDLSDCVVIGDDARVSSSFALNQIVIGQGARGNGNNTATIGNTSTTLTHLEGRVRTADYFDHRAPVTVTAATYTVGDATTYIIVNFAGTCNITLPTPASNTGRMLTIKTITANAVNSATGVNNVVPIDGDVAGNTILPATDGAWAQLVCDGTNWIIMQKG